MNQLLGQLKQLDGEIAKLENSSRLENDPNKKVAYMKQITTLKQKRAPLYYNTLSEEQKYKYLEGMFSMHIKMASDSRGGLEDVSASFYAKAYALDSRCDRFFARINKTFNAQLSSQPQMVDPNEAFGEKPNDEDILWETVVKHKKMPSHIDIGAWIGKGAIYGLVGLGIFFQGVMVYREGIKGFGFLIFFLLIAAPVYGYGVWKGHQQVGFYQKLAQSVGLRFSSAKGAMPLFLYSPFLEGTYKEHDFTLQLHQARPQGYTNQKMVTESLLATTIPPLKLKKALNINLNLKKAAPNWIENKNQINGLIGPELVEKVLDSLEKGSITGEIKINPDTITYAEFGPISNEKMVKTFKNAFDLLVMIASSIKASGNSTC